MKNSSKEWSDCLGICWVSFQLLFYSDCCYRMADPPEVVVEVVRWDGIDPVPKLPLFHSTAEDSFGGFLYIFGKPAIFWLEGLRAFMRFHRGDDEAPTQEAPVLARFRSFLVRYYGEDWKRWSCPIPARCYCSNCGQSSMGGSASWRSRGRSSARQWIIGHKLSSGRGLGIWRKPGASCTWTERLLPRGYTSLSFLSSYACTNPLRGKYSFVFGLHIPKFVRGIHCKVQTSLELPSAASGRTGEIAGEEESEDSVE